MRQSLKYISRVSQHADDSDPVCFFPHYWHSKFSKLHMTQRARSLFTKKI